MATQSLIPQEQDLSAQGAPPPEPSQTTPQTQRPEDIKKAFGLDGDDETNLIKVLKLHTRDWEIPRRIKLRDTLRAIEYDKGNQYIVWDPFSQAYFNPFTENPNGGGTQNNDDANTVYQCTSNIIQWLRRVWTSTLGAAVPGVEWWPGDSESDLDTKAAQARGRAYRKIAGDNKEKQILEQCLDYLFLTGSYFAYTRWSMDKTITGTHYEDVMGWQGQTIAPDRYTCPACGTDNPANDLNQQLGGTPCLNCGKQLGSESFHPAATINMPVVTGQREVPNGQVRWDIFNHLNVELMPTAQTTGGGPIANTPLLKLSCEITKGAWRRMYPSTWALDNTASSDANGSEGDMAKMARYRTATPGASRGIVMPKSIPTYHRVWFQPDSIFALDDQAAAQKLADKVGDGCMAVIRNDKIVDIRKAVLVKEWSWCGAKTGVGAMPPAPVEVALPYQDRFNDRTNSVDEFHDRAGNPPILFNQQTFGEALNGKFLPPGTMMGVPVNAELNRSLTDSFWQPTFKMDNGIYEWIKELLQQVQLLVGILPQTFGGSDPNVKTAAGQDQALKTAMGVLWLYWNQVRNEWTVRADISVDCFAANATQDEYDVTKSDDTPDFQNEPIRLTDLAGKAVARSEADQNYPIGFEQERQIFQQMIQMESGKEPNPLVMEILDTYENRRLAMRYLGPADLELPEQAFHDKVLNDIQQLIAPGAAPTPIQVEKSVPSGVVDPQTGQPQMVTQLEEQMQPTVMPDPDIDDMDVLIPTVIRYCIKHYQELKQNPGGFDNVRAYLKMAVQMKAAQTPQPLLTEGAPGWGGKLGQSAGKGAPTAPKPGAN